VDAAQLTAASSPEPRKVPLQLAPRPRAPNLNRLLVSAYKIFGFGVLTAILLGLVGYFSVNLFYLFDRRWALPAIISPTDERVLHLDEQEAEQESLRQKLLIERYDLEARLKDANRVIEVETAFQDRFSPAVLGDVQTRRAELRGLRSLFADYANTKSEIVRSNQAYSGLSRQRNQELLDAHLLEKDNYINTNFQLSEIAHSNLSLAENEANLLARTSELQHEISAMEATGKHGQPARSMSYETLRMEQELSHSKIEAARARDQTGSLRQSIQAIDESIETYDRMLRQIRESPYLKAVERNLNVAFMPYENASNMAKGTDLFACRFGLIGCHLVGKLGEPLDGEVSTKHPLHNQILRGVMVELDLVDPAGARPQVLFAHRPPLLF
jgi:hypothetical protein